MTARSHLRSLAAAGVVLIVVATALPLASAEGRGQVAPDELVLTDQTTLVAPGGTFSAAVLASGVGDAAAVRLTVHDRARSRTELARALAGEPDRAVLRAVTTPLADLAPEADGSQRASIALAGDPGRPVSTPGVYPVEIEVLDAGGDVLDDLVTDLVVVPEAADATPPLAVAVVAELGNDPAAPPTPDAARAVAEALSAVPDVPATLAVGPDLLEAAAASTEPDDAALLAALRAAAAGHPVLDLPYVPVAPDDLADAGIADELRHQRTRGTAILEEMLGVRASEQTWLAGPGLGADGLRILSALGIRRALVAPTAVERVTDGVLSPARPFTLAPPRQGSRRPTSADEPISALLLDPALMSAIGADAEPALVAAHTVGDLAQLWFEQPGTRRVAVLPVDADVDGDAVRRVLEALRSPALFRPVGLDAAFDAADPFVDGSGSPLRRSLVPADGIAITAATTAGVRDLRSLRGSVQGMVGDRAPALATLDRHLLRATAAGLTTAARQRELAEAQRAVDELADAVSSPDEFTITLTAREGTVPLTIRNDSGGPIQVRLRFSPGKLDLPNGRERTLTLQEQITRLDVAVRTRASGSFPFSVDITSPDGEVALATTRYSVRSTAVSGVGLLLSVGAGLFLIVWWARHWRESRATKLVDGPIEPT